MSNASTRSSVALPVTTNTGQASWKSLRLRPAAARPRSSAGSVTSARYFGVVKAWTIMPSATSPATSVIRGPTAARSTFGAPYFVFVGVNIGVISVCV